MCDIFVYVSLTYFTKHNIIQGHAHCYKWQHFILFLWISNIPLHTHTHPPPPLIQLSIDGTDVYVGCFHVLGIVASAMNTVVHESYQIQFSCFPDIYPGEELLDQQGSFIFRFLKDAPHWFSQWLHQFTSPPTVYEDSLFSRSSATFFDNSQSDRHEVISFSFDFHFSNNQ